MQIKTGFKRRDIQHVKKVFNALCEKQGCERLPEKDAADKLEEMGAVVGTGIYNSSSQNKTSDGAIGLEEFIMRAQAPQPIEEWTRSLPLAQLLADCLPRCEKVDLLEAVAKLSQNEIRVAAEAFKQSLMKILMEEINRLKELYAKGARDRIQEGSASGVADKFVVDAVSELRWGTIDDFHKGLSSRIGHAHTDYYKVMESEHCQGEGAQTRFSTENTKIETCPESEWNIVAGKEMPQGAASKDRKVRRIEDLESLSTSRDSKLIRPEIVAVVLYSGPMHVVYNTILRQPQDDALRNALLKSGSLFTVTIFVLTSAVQKISRNTSIPTGATLYRGLGADLPENFMRSDARGCSGFTEWGFMSASSDQEVAMRYSKRAGGCQRFRILCIQVSSVDRGAKISEYSQYPEEREYLFCPCSYIERAGLPRIEMADAKLFEMIPVRVNANLKAMTVEELLEEKKNAHLAAFSFLIKGLQSTLRSIADSNGAAEQRLRADTSRDDSHTVDGFLDRIIEQCEDVLSRHKSMNAEEFVQDGVFRKLVMEMMDVPKMAVSKLKEWLHNESYSFIRFRWGSPLKTAHRRWITFLETKLRRDGCSEEERISWSLDLCKATGLLEASTEEKNELGETRLMRAAAEGRAEKALNMLVDAGAKLDACREDGVTAIWLAAQFGHSHCITCLLARGASATQAANNGATPVYIAAQNGHADCIEILLRNNASALQADKDKIGPIHQAAMNGHTECIDILHSNGASLLSKNHEGQTPLDLAKKYNRSHCLKHILSLSGTEEAAAEEAAPIVKANKGLVISTGDISDVDGFYALAEYAKTGYDVLFIMNYPAYIGIDESGCEPMDYADKNPGLGFRYSAKQVLERTRPSESLPEKYFSFLEESRAFCASNDPACYSENLVMKQALTDLAFMLARNIWNECPGDNRGRLYFFVGGINAINPFSAAAIKNELIVFADLLPEKSLDKRLLPSQGTVYDEAAEECTFLLSDYSRIFIDFNGSLAFWDESWATKLSSKSTVESIQGVFVMGGVLTDQEPVTIASIPGVLNRFSSATMNQLYHPRHTAEFFAFLNQHKVKTYIVPNNAVGDLKIQKENAAEMAGVERFLTSNSLGGPYLLKTALAHYRNGFAQKPYDFYTALALCEGIKCCESGTDSARVLTGQTKTAYYSNVYRIMCISSSTLWEEARTEYVEMVEALCERPGLDVTKQEQFYAEVARMQEVDRMASLTAVELRFNLNADTKRLELSQDAAVTVPARWPRRLLPLPADPSRPSRRHKRQVPT